MGQRLATILVCLLVTAAQMRPVVVQASRSAPADVVLAWFESHADETIEAFLARWRPAPLDAGARAQVIASLPKQGELHPSGREVEKIAAAQKILDYNARSGIIEIKIIDVDQAFVGLHYRTVILASRHALNLVAADEFAALVAHEVGHDFDWNEYWIAREQHDHSRMRHLDLRADGFAVLILRNMHVDPDRLVSALQKVTRYNERLGATANAADYVSLGERLVFIQAMARQSWGGRADAALRPGSDAHRERP